MFQVLEAIPAYTRKTATHITQEAYDNCVEEFKKHLAKAFELFTAYWSGGDALLFNMSLEELLKAGRFMDSIIYAVGDEKTVEKLSKRATFMFDLACAMMGRNNVT